MKNQKGFIQIPILMGIVFGVIAIGVGSYFVTQKISEASKNKSIKNEAIAVNANQKVESVAGVATGNQGATNADQAATSTAEVPSEVDQLKKEVAVLKKEQDAQPKIIEKIIEKPVAMENSPVNNAPISSTVVVTPTAATNRVDQQAQKLAADKKTNDTYNQDTEKIVEKVTEGKRYHDEGMEYLTSHSDALAVEIFNDSIKSFSDAIDLNSSLNIPDVPFKDMLIQKKQLNGSFLDTSKQLSQADTSIAELNTEYPNSDFNEKLNLMNSAVDLEKQQKSIADQMVLLLKNIDVARYDYFQSLPGTITPTISETETPRDYCERVYGMNSNPSDNSDGTFRCVCKGGYVMQNNKCVTQ